MYLYFNYHMALKRIIVNERNLLASAKAGHNLPGFELKVYDDNGEYSHSYEAFTVRTLGQADVVHDATGSICGSGCFIETLKPVQINHLTIVE